MPLDDDFTFALGYAVWKCDRKRASIDKCQIQATETAKLLAAARFG
jgi:hypothetical protein